MAPESHTPTVSVSHCAGIHTEVREAPEQPVELNHSVGYMHVHVYMGVSAPCDLQVCVC